MGSLVVVRKDPSESDNAARMLTHELEHTRQANILGVFHPILYGLFWITIRLSLHHSHPYYSNPFELEARRAARQTVDIEGALKKLRDAKANASK